MVELDYYSPWYNRAPHLHESVGMLLLAVMVLRIVHRFVDPPPRPLKTLSAREQQLAPLVHALIYIAVFVVLISGYLISSAGDKSVAVFDWFAVPSLGEGIDKQQDIAGLWHERAAWLLIVLSGLHATAAFKHHFVDKDNTLLRMMGVRRGE